MEELSTCVTKHVKMSRAKIGEHIQANNMTSVPAQQQIQEMPLSSVVQNCQTELLPPMPQLQRMGTFNYTKELNFIEI